MEPTSAPVSPSSVTLTGPASHAGGERLGTAALALWAVGTQTAELLATVGAWGTAAWLAHDCYRRRSLPTEGFPGAKLLGGFVAAALLLPALGGHLPTGGGLARLLDWLLLPVAAWGLARLPTRGLRTVALAAGFGLLASTMAAGLQHYGLWPREEAFAALAWTRIPFERVYEAMPGTEGRFMGGGLLFHRLKYAGVTALAALVFLGLGLRQTPTTRPTQRALWLGLAAGGALGMARFPQARAALAAMLLGGLSILVASAAARRRALILALLGGAGAIGLWLATPSLREPLLARGSGERQHLVRAGLRAVAAHPLTGLGPGRFRPSDFLEADAPLDARQHRGKAHNQLVSLAAETGLPAVTLLLCFLGALAMHFVRAARAGATGLGLLVFFFSVCLLHDLLFHPEVSQAWMLALGAATWLSREKAPTAEPFDAGTPTGHE